MLNFAENKESKKFKEQRHVPDSISLFFGSEPEEIYSRIIAREKQKKMCFIPEITRGIPKFYFPRLDLPF